MMMMSIALENRQTDRQTDGRTDGRTASSRIFLPSFLPSIFHCTFWRASYKEAQCVPVRVADGCDCCMTPCSLVDITDSSEEYSVCVIKVASSFDTSVHSCHHNRWHYVHIDNIEAHFTDQRIYNSLRGTILFDKLTVPQLVKKLPVLYYGTWKFIIVFTRARSLWFCPEPDESSPLTATPFLSDSF